MWELRLQERHGAQEELVRYLRWQVVLEPVHPGHDPRPTNSLVIMSGDPNTSSARWSLGIVLLLAQMGAVTSPVSHPGMLVSG